MTALFTPKRLDGIAEWRIVYEMAQRLSPGETITYDTLAEALDIDSSNRSPIYKAVGRANKELRRHDYRSLEPVATVGYRVLLATEHVLQSRRYVKQGRRRISTGLEVVEATDLSRLSGIERQQTVALSMVLQGMCQAISHLDQRQRRTEVALSKVVQDTDQRLSEQEQQMSRMAEAMREAGILRT
jgi:hypothetical protein